LPCIYLGPSDDHKGSRCFDPPSGRVLISRHVTFDENTFPFSTIQSPTVPTPLSTSTAPISRHVFVPVDPPAAAAKTPENPVAAAKTPQNPAAAAESAQTPAVAASPPAAAVSR